MSKPEQPDQSRHPGHSAQADRPEQPEAWGAPRSRGGYLVRPGRHRGHRHGSRLAQEAVGPQRVSWPDLASPGRVDLRG